MKSPSSGPGAKPVLREPLTPVGSLACEGACGVTPGAGPGAPRRRRDRRRGELSLGSPRPSTGALAEAPGRRRRSAASPGTALGNENAVFIAQQITRWKRGCRWHPENAWRLPVELGRPPGRPRGPAGG